MNIFEYVNKFVEHTEPIKLEIGLDKVVYDSTGNGKDTRYFTVKISGTDVTRLVAEATGLKLSRAKRTSGSLIVHGSGMDMGFFLQSRMYSAAYREGYPDMFDKDDYKYLGKRIRGQGKSLEGVWTEELEQKYNTPAEPFPTEIADIVACPVCGHRHGKATKSKRCCYCGQKLDV